MVEDVGLEPLFLLPKQACYRYTTSSIWWNQGGLNSRPPACKAGALPTELRPHIGDFVRYFEELNLSITLITGSSPYLHRLLHYSATRETSLSFGERPLTSYPSIANG